MVKFFKPGKVVVVLNGRNAGKKGIIIKSNYENSKDKKYPHCLVVGLSKGPRKATKRSLKKLDEKVKKLEGKSEANLLEQLNRLKRLGVFIKTYNMSHLLVTRYHVKEDFGIQSSLERLERIEADAKDTQVALNRKEAEKKEENKKEIELLRKQLAEHKDKFRSTLREVKSTIGTELLNRFMKGFVRTTNSEENEKITDSEFLFKKLKF